MDEQQIWAFLDHFEEETLARAKMLSDLGYGGGGVDDVDDLIEETGRRRANVRGTGESPGQRSEEHTSELQSLMRISYAVFCLKKKRETAGKTMVDTQLK